MLGIVIGITAVILSLSIGESAQTYILSQISGFGADKLIIMSGPKTQTPTESPFVEESLTLNDVKALKKQSWEKYVSAETFQTDLFTAQGTSKNGNVFGTLPDEIQIMSYATKEGVFFSDSDAESHARVAVLGSGIADELFGAGNAVGRSLKIGTAGFRIIGVMQPLGVQFFQNMDDMVYIPITTLMDLYHKKHVQYLIMTPAIPMAQAIPRVEDALRDAHNISNPERDLSKDDFHVMTQEDAVKTVSQITGVLQILLASIAAISLLVGGIGIMNIMYVSVTERISEIGLRKSVGARYADVLRQFLAEATLLTFGGGLIGIVTGTSLSWITIQIINSYQLGWVFLISWRGVFIGVVISTLIGLLFGYLPARRAALLSPIDALRTE